MWQSTIKLMLFKEERETVASDRSDGQRKRADLRDWCGAMTCKQEAVELLTITCATRVMLQHVLPTAWKSLPCRTVLD